jgi:hypothetical protein
MLEWCGGEGRGVLVVGGSGFLLRVRVMEDGEDGAGVGEESERKGGLV